LRSGKPDIRVYGQAVLTDRDSLPSLSATLPPDAWSIQDGVLDIDYAGFFLDVEDFLDTAARLMQNGDSGHLDIFDDEHQILTRYDLARGGHLSKTHRYDDILEHTKGEGNW
jgi:hypothetical protein